MAINTVSHKVTIGEATDTPHRRPPTADPAAAAADPAAAEPEAEDPAAAAAAEPEAEDPAAAAAAAAEPAAADPDNPVIDLQSWALLAGRRC